MFFDYPPPEEQRWLTDEAGFFQPLKVEGLGGVRFESVIFEIDMVGHTIDYIDFRVSFEKRHNAGDCAGVVNVIGVQPADDLAIRRDDAFVDGIRLSFVFLRYPMHWRAKTFEDFDRVVRAAAIADDMLDFHTVWLATLRNVRSMN